jgi:DNA-binding HxlR family transcriptional regulator
MLAILWASAEEGAVRFNEFKQALEGIPPRTLALRLVELENAGVHERRVLPHTRPPRGEYKLTPAGRRLGALVDAMRAYAAHA